MLPETSALDFTISGERRVSAFLTLGMRGQYASNDSPVGTGLAVRSFRLTASQRLRDDWRAELEAGMEQQVDETPGGGHDAGPVRFSGRGVFCYEPERTSLCLNADLRSMMSGLGLRREFAVGLQARRQVSERGSLAFDASYRRAPLREVSGNADVLVAGASYEHRLGRRFRLIGGVDYLRRNQPASGAIGAIAGRIGISFRENWR